MLSSPIAFEVSRSLSSFCTSSSVVRCNFIKVAKDNADRLGITGWIKNNKTGTVGGRLQGPKSHVDQMVKWLSEEGSPGCHIERCQLSNQQAIIRPDYPKFSLKF
ncbi:acylphosphatase-2 isoform X1 [Cherax quadricarinatus]|uniref:acylphosphatase-2 isoform X1 n=1 Tax=Cherax quadricarinatus TaxID=27406 RepID=UPI0023790353|nr:acylphosphatase-2-like isoform X1 [Cherax quadricarinatus]